MHDPMCPGVSVTSLAKQLLSAAAFLGLMACGAFSDRFVEIYVGKDGTSGEQLRWLGPQEAASFPEDIPITLKAFQGDPEDPGSLKSVPARSAKVQLVDAEACLVASEPTCDRDYCTVTIRRTGEGLCTARFQLMTIDFDTLNSSCWVNAVFRGARSPQHEEQLEQARARCAL